MSCALFPSLPLFPVRLVYLIKVPPISGQSQIQNHLLLGPRGRGLECPSYFSLEAELALLGLLRTLGKGDL